MFKIKNIKILLVCRKGIGKTHLIKYMLEISDYGIYDDGNKENFKIYASKRVNYLKLFKINRS